MIDTLAIIAPAGPAWLSLQAGATLLRLELRFFTGMDTFLAAELAPSQTVVAVDADHCTGSIASVVHTLANDGHAGVIAISQSLTSRERIALISLGADHCLDRPLDGDELAAIANNLLRRSHAGDDRSRNDFAQDCWVLDLKQWRLTTPKGAEIILSAGELSLLAVMLEAPGRTHARKDLLAHFGKAAHSTDARSVDVLISRLRRKVEDVSAARLPLRSARGEGYVFASPATIIA